MERLRQLFRRQASAADAPAVIPPDPINDYYVTDAPSPQGALDIFKGEWSSQLPPPFDGLQAGSVPLFDDGRITWLVDELEGIHGQSILELGPLEGGHSYMLEASGAASVTAIEANTHSYLRCLIAKELLGMQRVKFLCGDFVEYLKSLDCGSFDIGVASGVLYHMVNPVELISLLSKSCRSHLLIWTHYYDEAWATANERQAQFPSRQEVNVEGFSHTLVRQDYGDETLGMPEFCGGSRRYSNWMVRDELVQCLNYFGFANVKTNFDHYDHPHGPAMTLLASR